MRGFLSWSLLGVLVIAGGCASSDRVAYRSGPGSASGPVGQPGRAEAAPFDDFGEGEVAQVLPPQSPRGVWVVRHALKTRASITSVVREARTAGMDRLIVQVRGRGDAWYRSRTEPRAEDIEAGLDPLAETIVQARAAGLQVHAWINLMLVASGENLPASPDHVARRNPDWLSRTEAQASWPSDDRLLERLLRAAHEDPSYEGVYLDPAHPGVRSHLSAVALELVTRYELDGLHLDYVRYAGSAHGCSPRALARFGGGRDEAAVSRGLARRKRDPATWRYWRRQRVDELVRGIARAVREARPGLVLSAAVRPDARQARDRVGQDWGRWLAEGWLDVACPMNYAVDRTEFARISDSTPEGRIWMGIGAWRLTAREIVRRTRLSEQEGHEAVLLFSHEAFQSASELTERLAEAPRAITTSDASRPGERARPGSRPRAPRPGTSSGSEGTARASRQTPSRPRSVPSGREPSRE